MPLWSCATLHGVVGPSPSQPGSETRGILLAFVLLGAEEEGPLALPAEARNPCLSAWQALAGLGATARSDALATWRAQAESGLALGIEGLHPSWVAAALAGESPEAVACARAALPEALRAGLDGILPGADRGAVQGEIWPDIAATVARLALAPLAPYCEADCGPLAQRLCALPFRVFEEELIRTGARALGHALARTTPSLRARALAWVGSPWAKVMADAFADVPCEDEGKAAAACAAMGARGLGCMAVDRLLGAGLAMLRGSLAEEHPGSLARVAGRLPVALAHELLGASSPPTR